MGSPVSEKGEELAPKLKVPPRGNVAWARTIWTRPHESVYIVQASMLDDPEEIAAMLTTVLVSVVHDACEEGLELAELLSDAQVMLDQQNEDPE